MKRLLHKSERTGSISWLILPGHTSNNSLPVFARKPAPVQVTWLGYPNTTGLKTIDYRLTDAVADPEGEADRLHSEKLIRLEHGFLCYQPAASAPQVATLPCLQHGYITFGSFNNLTKVTPEVVKAWTRILLAVPGSRLLLKAKQLTDDNTRARFKEMFAREGITGERIEMLKRLENPEDHLEIYSRVDIRIGSFPIQWHDNHLRGTMDGGAGGDAARDPPCRPRWGLNFASGRTGGTRCVIHSEIYRVGRGTGMRSEAAAGNALEPAEPNAGV